MNIPFLTQDLRGELELRLSKVRREMKEEKLDAVLIASSVNMYYMSGCVFRGYVYITVDRDPVYFLIAPSFSDDRGCVEIHKPEQIAAHIDEYGIGSPTRLGLEFSDMLYSDIERLKKCFPQSQIADASMAMRRARIIKTVYEIRKIREDGLHQAAVYSQVHKCHQEGMTDLELQIEIERVLRREGCLGILRAAGNRMELNLGSVISGDNADIPSPYDFAMGGEGTDPSLPVGANGVTLRPGTVVMVDMNGGFNGYQSDMTRCWSIGEVPALARKAHECSRHIVRRLEEIGRPGLPVSRMYSDAIEIAKEEGVHEYFMGYHYKARFIGHGLGIELNEMPVIMERNHVQLKENMVIALEPKFVIPHVGAVGVENTYRVTEMGLENLTPFPEELTEL